MLEIDRQKQAGTYIEPKYNVLTDENICDYISELALELDKQPVKEFRCVTPPDWFIELMK
jgi:hypothetical protein